MNGTQTSLSDYFGKPSPFVCANPGQSLLATASGERRVTSDVSSRSAAAHRRDRARRVSRFRLPPSASSSSLARRATFQSSANGASDKTFAADESSSTKSREGGARRQHRAHRQLPAQNFRASAARFFWAATRALLPSSVLRVQARKYCNQNRRLSFAQCRDR